MGLRLFDVAPRQGWQWISQAFALWRKRPMSFVGLFTTFLLSELALMALVPVVGGLLGLALVPMLSLGFMIASRSVLADGPVLARMYIAGLRVPDKPRRRAQWLLCGGYALGTVLVITAADWLDGGSLDALMREMSKATPGEPSPAVVAAMSEPQLLLGLVLRTALATLLSVPFWHASALVHWGGQGAGQALFSSTLALWRTRRAFLVYGLGWLGLMAALTTVSALLVLLLGLPRLMGTLAMVGALVASTVFYLSLWFCFVDTFGAPASDSPVPLG